MWMQAMSLQKDFCGRQLKTQENESGKKPSTVETVGRQLGRIFEDGCDWHQRSLHCELLQKTALSWTEKTVEEGDLWCKGEWECVGQNKKI